MISVQLKSKEAAGNAQGSADRSHSLASLFSSSAPRQYKRGDRLHTGSSTPDIYLLEKGVVKLSSVHHGEEVLEDYLHTGALLNWQAILGTPTDHLVAEALSREVVARVMSAQQMAQIARESIGLASRPGHYELHQRCSIKTNKEKDMATP